MLNSPVYTSHTINPLLVQPSGAIQGRVPCPRALLTCPSTPLVVYWRSRGLNHQPSGKWATLLTSWCPHRELWRKDISCRNGPTVNIFSWIKYYIPDSVSAATCLSEYILFSNTGTIMKWKIRNAIHTAIMEIIASCSLFARESVAAVGVIQEGG